MENDKPLTRDALVSMEVIDAKGRLVGKVKDVAFAIGKNGISLSVEGEDGQIQNVAWDEVQAAADYIILKPVAQAAYQQSYQPQQQAAQPVVSRSAGSASSVAAALPNLREAPDLDSTVSALVLL